MGTPLTGASNAGEVGTNRDSGRMRRVAGYRSIAAVCDAQLPDRRRCRMYHSSSARLFTA